MRPTRFPSLPIRTLIQRPLLILPLTLTQTPNRYNLKPLIFQQLRTFLTIIYLFLLIISFTEIFRSYVAVVFAAPFCGFVATREIILLGADLIGVGVGLFCGVLGRFVEEQGWGFYGAVYEFSGALA